MNVKTILFQTIQFRVITVSMSKTVLFQIIQFSISTQFSSVRLIDWALSAGKRGPGNGDNQRVLRIPQSFSITEASSSDGLVS